MDTRARLVGAAILLAGMMTAPVSGHHGTAASYDGSKQVTIIGKVTEFWWRNPHSALFIDTIDDKGERINWSVEMNSPGVLLRAGWTRRTFVAGDAQPKGSPNAEILEVIFAPIDEKEFNERVRNPAGGRSR